MKPLLLFLFSFTLLLSSCDDQEKVNELKKREAVLQLKEQEFATKEKDYESLKKLRDSLNNISTETDTIKLPVNLLGKWTGKMICTESNCSENVIGDLRNDIWEFSENNLKITNKNGGEKIYTIKQSGSEVKFTAENTPTSSSQSIITLQIPEQPSDRIKGSRELIGNNCNSKFSVDLEKLKN